MSAGDMIGADVAARLVIAWGPTAEAMVRHDLADLIRTLNARCAARRVAVALTRAEWREIEDDVSALSRSDDQRNQYRAAQRAARAMGLDDVGAAIDVLCDLTGETADEWALRVCGDMTRAVAA